MEKTRLIMGMPIIINIAHKSLKNSPFEKVFEYFNEVDNRFSTYKKDSEISQINNGKLKVEDSSLVMKKVFKLSEKTKKETNGFFDIQNGGKYDPSGLVKGWAIYEASKILKKMGYKNFYISAGGDIQVSGKNELGQPWTVGIKNPFDQSKIVKALKIKNQGVATSGNYIRGAHIYNPKGQLNDDVVSLTVIGPNIYEADRFATAAFAMGRQGIEFIENLPGFEGYLIDKSGIGTMTTGWEGFTQ
jgi:thiamine biosynthesis lipoprotein